jgi:hypothetical protein
MTIDAVARCNRRQRQRLAADTPFTFFTKHNLIEFKSPHDRLTDDEFHLILSRAHLYAIQHKVKNLNDMLICVISVSRPNWLLNGNWHTARFARRSPGVYEGNLLIPCYVMVMTELPVEPVNHPLLVFTAGRKREEFIQTLVADGDPELLTFAYFSEAVPGAMHDKKLSDAVQTVERLPDGCAAAADKGYQGLEAQVSLVKVVDTATGQEEQVPRLRVHTPFKKPRGGELTEEQRAFNRRVNTVRVRVEHCIGWAKNWAILATRFRCDHLIYTLIMQTVCGLVNAQTQRWQAAKVANCA